MIPNQFYHVFNHANGRENLFVEDKNYKFFLEKLAFHIFPACRIYAYCLMRNHFHLLISTRNKEELFELWQSPDAYKILDDKKISLKISKVFSNLFSSYTQAFNKVYDRMGSLFIPSMKTESIETDDSFRRVVHYIHNNPVHHGFISSIENWPHSSYKIFFSNGPTKIERQYVLKVFGGIDKFIEYHSKPVDSKNKWIEG
jgi:REP element-mobilizing transposase RayT